MDLPPRSEEGSRSAAKEATAPPGALRTLWGRVQLAIGVAVAAALSVSPIFSTSLLELFWRTLFVSLVLVGVFFGVQRWPAQRLPRWLPRWVAIAVAVGVAAPLATFAVYLLSVRGDLIAFISNDARVRGFFILASIGLVLGVLFALGALLQQREAEARAQALRFELERSQLERQALDARLSLLQAQVQPHFLFNTLANVQALVESGSPRAPEVLRALTAYLRAAVPRLHDGPTTLGEELQRVRAYLQLMQMRMPDRLRFRVVGDTDLDGLPFPALSLLTLVENAVQHGLDPSTDGGEVEVGLARETDPPALRAWVRDTGVGLDPMAAPGTGLQNLRARLAALHGAAATLNLSEVSPRGVHAEIRLPLS